MRKVLITGAAGFIGANLMAHLNSLGFHTHGIDLFTDYYAVSMKESRIKNFVIDTQISRIDVCDSNAVSRIVDQFQPDQIIHLAAQGGVRASQTNPEPYLQSNQLGFLNMLRISEQRTKLPFIYGSSSSVYGDSLRAPFREDQELGELKSLYALSKLSNELIAKHLPGNGVPRIGLRFFTVYGPWGRPDMAMFRLLASKKLDTNFKLTADLSIKRDFTFVDDVSNYIVSLLEKKDFTSNYEIFNVGGGKPYTLRQLFNILKDLDFLPRIDVREQSELDVRMTNASIAKSEAYKLRVPNISLSEGVRKTISWIEQSRQEDILEWHA
jgi:UDP-glucuronate 4-epimerase